MKKIWRVLFEENKKLSDRVAPWKHKNCFLLLFPFSLLRSSPHCHACLRNTPYGKESTKGKVNSRNLFSSVHFAVIWAKTETENRKEGEGEGDKENRWKERKEGRNRLNLSHFLQIHGEINPFAMRSPFPISKISDDVDKTTFTIKWSGNHIKLKEMFKILTRDGGGGEGRAKDIEAVKSNYDD